MTILAFSPHIIKESLIKALIQSWKIVQLFSSMPYALTHKVKLLNSEED